MNNLLAEMQMAVRLAETMEEAEVFADQLREASGLDYKVHPHRRRFVLQYMPRVGDEIVYSIGSDTHYDGAIVKTTKTTFKTESGRVYRWSAKRMQWNQQGCSYVVARPGSRDDEKMDPHF